jgi:cytidylate kinase
MLMAIVTIRGQLGSGAPALGMLIADDLGYDYVDREIIADVATTLSRHRIDIEEKEMPAPGLLGRIAEALQHSYSPIAMADGRGIPILPPVELPLDDGDYLDGLVAVIKNLASKGNIVLCGRGSQFILMDRQDAFHVLVIAPLEQRIQRVVKGSHVSEELAKKKIADYDARRREFIKRYFGNDLEDPMNYDIVLNTDRLTFEAAANAVVHILRSKNEPWHADPAAQVKTAAVPGSQS